MTYNEFLKSKQITIEPSGFDIDISDLNSALFDWQKDIDKWALKKGKCALFEDCGLGKTPQQLEFADQVHKHTGGNVLILAPLAVAKQTQREGEKFGYKVNVCRTQTDVKPGINITNYEMLEHFDTSKFIGVVLDESSILKNYTGKTRTQITNAFKNTPYKLCCTATPAPNDYMELLNHAEFLGVCKTAEALAMFFINDMKTGNWRLKGYAIKNFWEWVGNWALCVDNPSSLGYDGSNFILPKLNEIEVVIPIDEASEDYEEGFFRKIETNATAFYKEKRHTAEKRAIECANIINHNQNEQFLIWCYTNEEANLLKKYIPSAVEVRGSDKPEYKEQSAIDFANGNIPVLICKTGIFGYGLNFQKCHNMIFCGLDYSYESYYQAIRRCWRFGQKEVVNVHIVLGSTEYQLLQSIKRKEEQHQKMKLSMNTNIKQIQLNIFKGIKTDKILKQEIQIPNWLEVANG